MAVPYGPWKLFAEPAFAVKRIESSKTLVSSFSSIGFLSLKRKKFVKIEVWRANYDRGDIKRRRV